MPEVGCVSSAPTHMSCEPVRTFFFSHFPSPVPLLCHARTDGGGVKTDTDLAMAHSGCGANNKSVGCSRDCDGVESASDTSRADDPATNNHTAVGLKTKLLANHLKLERPLG